MQTHRSQILNHAVGRDAVEMHVGLHLRRVALLRYATFSHESRSEELAAEADELRR